MKKQHKKHIKNEDYHHILFQKRHWNTGYLKALRTHPYCGGYIPQQTIHRAIHSQVHDIPSPNGKDCKQAIEALNSWLVCGFISLDDPITRKIDVIIGCFKAKYPATVAMLEYQKEVIIKAQNKEV